MVDAAGAQARLADREAVALAREQRRRGHANVLEEHFGVALAVPVAEHGQPADDRHPGRVDRHHEHRLLLVGRAVGIGLAHDDQHLAVAVQRVGRPPLAAVDHVLVAVALDPRLDVGGVRARRPPARSSRTPSGSRRRAAAAATCSLCSSVPKSVRTSMLPVSGALQFIASGARWRLRPMISASGAYSAFVRPGPHSSCGWKRFHRPRSSRLRLQLLEDRGVVVGVAGRRHLLRVDRLGGVDALVHERLQPLLVVLAAVGQLEVHLGSLARTWSRRLQVGWRWRALSDSANAGAAASAGRRRRRRVAVSLALQAPHPAHPAVVVDALAAVELEHLGVGQDQEALRGDPGEHRLGDLVRGEDRRRPRRPPGRRAPPRPRPPRPVVYIAVSTPIGQRQETRIPRSP